MAAYTNRLTILLLTAMVCAVMLSARFVRAQQPPPLNGIAHIAIRVRDLGVSRSFYQKLGFEEAFALSRDGAVYESFIKINDRQFLELYPIDTKNSQIGFLHLCFEGADLEAISQDYVSRGLTLKTTLRKAGAGNLLFTMDGPVQPFGAQNIEYTQYMPGSLHSNDFGKHLGADRIADRMVTVTLAMNDPAAAQAFYLKQLRFTASPRDPMLLGLPGNSGEEVEIAPPALGQKARVAFHAGDLPKAEAHLHQQQVQFTSAKGALTVTDPDGNVLLIQPR